MWERSKESRVFRSKVGSFYVGCSALVQVHGEVDPRDY